MSARRSRFASWFASSPPTVGVEIGARRVTAVSLGEHGGKPMVTAHATEVLPEGLVTPSLNQPNITDRAAVGAALGRVLSQIGGRPGRVALVVPDGAAKVSLVKFDKVPAKAEDLEQLIRWQVKKSVPFPLEQAQVTWTRGATDAAGGVEFVVAIARRDIIEEYEAVCQAANAQAGLVDLATLNLINLALIADPSLAGATAASSQRRRACMTPARIRRPRCPSTGCSCTSAPIRRRWRSCAARRCCSSAIVRRMPRGI